MTTRRANTCGYCDDVEAELLKLRPKLVAVAKLVDDAGVRIPLDIYIAIATVITGSRTADMKDWLEAAQNG